MILRRITAAVRRQDWFTVAVETMIVVLGVFLGLQVNNWNAARIEAREGGVFTERLLADLRIEAWNYDVMIAYLREVQDNADRALAILEGSLVAPDKALLVSAYRATQYVDGVRRRATFDELTSTGSLGLIADRSLRDTAALVYTSPVVGRAGEEGVDTPYRRAFRMLLTVEIQDALERHCGDRFMAIGDYGVIRNQLSYDCDPGLALEELTEAAQILRHDPDLVALLRLRAMNVRTQIGNLTFANKDIMDSLHAIAKEPQQ